MQAAQRDLSKNLRPVGLEGVLECGTTQEGLDFWTQAQLYQVHPVTAGEECKRLCLADVRCGVWTWGKARQIAGLSDICFLKALAPGETPEGLPNSRKVSGIVCRTAGGYAEPVKGHRAAGCGTREDKVDYSTDRLLYKASPVMDADECASMCEAEKKCAAWTWGSPGAGPDIETACLLKAQRPHGRPVRNEGAVGAVSGLPCRTVTGHEEEQRKSGEEAVDWRGAIGATPSPAGEQPGALREGAETTSGTSGNGTDSVYVRRQVCPMFEINVDYNGAEVLTSAHNVFSAAECQLRCTQDLSCWAWTWGAARGVEGLTDVCFLKAAGPMVKSDLWGRVSGRPCTTELRTAPRGADTIYCFSLMQPTGYESGLIKLQYARRLSIFACDATTVFSSKVLHLAPGLKTVAVDSDLKCQIGGEFQTALNTDIFHAVWKKVAEMGTYRLHAWTLKVDPDCVFFAARLRGVLEFYSPWDEAKGMYLNNCRMGLHGPIEVFSAKAVEVWVDGFQQCVDHFFKLCSGDCLWGEDMFMDQCFIRVLKVKRVDDWSLLVEDHCAPPVGWQSCEDRTKVAFHPFKTEDGYRDCLVGGGEIPRDEQSGSTLQLV